MTERLNWTELIYVWKLIKETSTNITFGKAWRGNSHSLSLTHLPYHSFADLNKKKCNFIWGQKWHYFTTPQVKGRFPSCPATSSTNRKTYSSVRNCYHPELFTFFQWIFIFLLLRTSLSHPPFYESLPSYITSSSISLLARWDIAKSCNKVH